MAPILTAEDVVMRIAAECTFVGERGAVAQISEQRAVESGSFMLMVGAGFGVEGRL